MGKMIDIRIMKLNKWYVPKSFDLDELQNPVILGYFDELQLRPGNDVADEKTHPFTAGYNELIKWKSKDKTELVDFSSQEQILFMDICEEGEQEGTGFTEADIQNFWADGTNTSPFLFLSMIHISHSGKMMQALEKIRKVFRENYLSYISYDYCDIVLFAKNLQIHEFMKCIRKLFAVESGEEKVIFDTFSMVSFYPGKALELEDKQPENAEGKNEKPFQVTINLSIRNHKAFNEWYKRESENQKLKVRRYNLFGRHDISITKDDADTKWLMRIMKMLHDKSNQKKFWTFETFIKVADDEWIDVDSDTADSLEEIHESVRKRLQSQIDQLKAVIDASDIEEKNRYILPVYEVRDCICSIVKNSFAEEFVCCVYESFLHFVTYMTVEIQKIAGESKNRNQQEDKIAKTYDKYFAALNTLVNSTMHNERQFVQATAFNAIFYSVPPKIMAFYNAYIYRIKQILKDNSGKEYTFLIYPSFSPVISVKQISLNDTPPCDRILTVTISEKSLYDIESVMYQMVHELAHYVGGNLRCREVRRQKIMPALLRWILAECRIEEENYRILRQLTDKNVEDRRLYLEYLPDEGKRLLQLLEDPESGHNLFLTYYQDKWKEEETFEDEFLADCGIEAGQQSAYAANYAEQYASTKYQLFRRKLMRFDKDNKAGKYRQYIELIKYVYRECYADLQMILVLGMRAEDYLKTFLTKLDVTLKNLLHQPKTMIRICTIFRVMTDCGLWERPGEKDNENFRTVYALIKQYNKMIEDCTEQNRILATRQKTAALADAVSGFDFENGIRLKGSLTKDSVALTEEEKNAGIVPFPDIAAGLYEYLLEVLEVSLEEYSDRHAQNQSGNGKAEKICQVRKLVKKILEFKNVVEAFNCIEAELDYYKHEGCRIYVDNQVS